MTERKKVTLEERIAFLRAAAKVGAKWFEEQGLDLFGEYILGILRDQFRADATAHPKESWRNRTAAFGTRLITLGSILQSIAADEKPPNTTTEEHDDHPE